MYRHILDILTTTRLFHNGNSQAVRIPAELAYERSDLELEIERCGDELRIRPAGRPITGALEALAAFSPLFLADGREQGVQQERESL
jgi:antitoxin VapB